MSPRGNSSLSPPVRSARNRSRSRLGRRQARAGHGDCESRRRRASTSSQPTEPRSDSWTDAATAPTAVKREPHRGQARGGPIDPPPTFLATIFSPSSESVANGHVRHRFAVTAKLGRNCWWTAGALVGQCKQGTSLDRCEHCCIGRLAVGQWQAGSTATQAVGGKRAVSIFAIVGTEQRPCNPGTGSSSALALAAAAPWL